MNGLRPRFRARLGRALATGALVCGALAAAWGARSALSHELDSSVWSLGAALERLSRVESTAAPVDWDAVEREVVASEGSSLNVAPTASSPTPGAAKAHTGKTAAVGPKVVFVSADQVLRLSKVAKVPASRFVETKGARPAGLQVAGVNGFGIGVRDGDVVTHVAGARVTSSAAVISTVLKLRAQRAAAISGEFWRGQERFQIVFQMPYLASQTAASGSQASASAPSSDAAPRGTSAMARN